MKLSKLQSSLVFPNSHDVARGIQWLKDNRHKFDGRVYEPFFMEINVCDPANNAKYLESVIDAKDLVFFAAENFKDFNALRKHFSALKLKVMVRMVLGVSVNANDGQLVSPEFFKGYL